MIYAVLTFLIAGFFSSAEDFQQIAKDLQRQSVEVQQQIDPLVQEAAVLERQNAEALAEQARRAEKAKELLVKTEKLKGDIKTKVNFQTLQEILDVSSINRCRISQGSEPNEIHITQEGISIRVLFAPESSPRQPFATFHTVNGVDYYKILQPDYDPANPSSTTGPMFADIRLDGQKRIVHAIFRGQMIKDRGLFGLLGSSLIPRGMTCITMEATDSI